MESGMLIELPGFRSATSGLPSVIASEARQSRCTKLNRVDCHVAHKKHGLLAMTTKQPLRLRASAVNQSLFTIRLQQHAFDTILIYLLQEFSFPVITKQLLAKFNHDVIGF